jgi:DNA-binding MarR family transcriptional regulator
MRPGAAQSLHAQRCSAKFVGSSHRFAMSARKAVIPPKPPALALETFLPYRLNVAATLVSQGLARIYSQRHDIGIPEWRVIATLGEFGSMTAKAIGAHSHMHKTKVSRAVAVLQARGWVLRKVNASDQRESFLALSARGRAVYDDLVPIALDYARRLDEVIGERDSISFDRALDRLIAHAAAAAGPADEEMP